MEPLRFSVLKSEGGGEREKEREREREIHGIHKLEGGKEAELRDIQQKPRAAEATGRRNEGLARAKISLEHQKVETEKQTKEKMSHLTV